MLEEVPAIPEDDISWQFGNTLKKITDKRKSKGRRILSKVWEGV